MPLGHTVRFVVKMTSTNQQPTLARTITIECIMKWQSGQDIKYQAEN